MPTLTDYDKVRANMGHPPGADWVEYDGNPRAPVLVAGWQARTGEKLPFEADGGCVRRVLREFNVSPGLVRLGYVVKFPTPNTFPGGPLAAHVAGLFWREVEQARHPVVVLLGLDAARAVLAVPDQEIGTLRRTRFTWPGRSGATFFVTHAAPDLRPDDPTDPVTNEFVDDLLAVFHVDGTHYDRTRILKG